MDTYNNLAQSALPQTVVDWLKFWSPDDELTSLIVDAYGNRKYRDDTDLQNLDQLLASLKDRITAHTSTVLSDTAKDAFGKLARQPFGENLARPAMSQTGLFFTVPQTSSAQSLAQTTEPEE